MKYIFYVSLFLTLNTQALEGVKIKNKFIWINLSHAEPHDFDTVYLSNFRGNNIELNCSQNPFFQNKHSYIKYSNIYGIHVKDFLFKEDYSCHALKKFLISVFPAIDEKKLVKIKFNLETGYVEKILLPDLDIYENGDIYYEDKETEQIANI